MNSLLPLQYYIIDDDTKSISFYIALYSILFGYRCHAEYYYEKTGHRTVMSEAKNSKRLNNDASLNIFVE